MDPNALNDGIRLALAPVFLLTGVASLIGAVATRLARIIDRARMVEDRMESGSVRNMAAAFRELQRLRVRGGLANLSILLLTLCAVLIALTVVALFLGETTALQTQRIVSFSFLGGIGLFVVALLAFLVESLMATSVLRFRTRPAAEPGE